jgi:hypothetical protein
LRESYYQKNKSWLCARQRILNRRHRAKVKTELFGVLGGECAICGFTDIRALQIDHINGGGKKEKYRLHGRQMLYFSILEKIKIGSKEYQILCANCNWIKRVEMNEVGG